MLVRVPAGDTNGKSEDSAWEEIDLPVTEAASLLEKGKAEPVVSIRDHNPLLPVQGLSLLEAFNLFVGQHPNVLEIGGLRHRYNVIWPTTFTKKSACRYVARLRRPRRTIKMTPMRLRGERSRRNDEDTIWIRGKPTLTSEAEFRKDADHSTAIFIEYHAIRNLLEQLAAGTIVAKGVFEGNLATLKETEIAAAWWDRSIEILLSEGAIWEFISGTPDEKKRMWTSVRIIADDSSRVRVNPDEISHSGGPGRPSSMHLVMPEFDRRCRQNKLLSKLTHEAKYLSDWLKENFPSAPPLTAKTIENRIRPRYRVAQTKARDT